MTSDEYFRGGSGTRYTYAEIAARIRKEAPHTLGKHISVQLEAIGLYDELMNAATPCGLPFTFAEAPCPLVVPSGIPLIAGKLYLQLYHGRKDPSEEMQGWGFTGPTFGPLDCVTQTYVTDLWVHACNSEEMRLRYYDDLIVWDNAYFGATSIFVATGAERG